MEGKQMTKKEKEFFNIKLAFNDAFMRETGLDIDDNDHIYDMEEQSIIQIKEKFIKYCDYEYPVLEHNEIDFNLIENPRLTEILAFRYLKNHIANEIVAMDQSPIPGSDKGHFVMSYIKGDKTLQMQSKAFTNESLRILNLICKINKTEHLYDFNAWDVQPPTKSRK